MLVLSEMIVVIVLKGINNLLGHFMSRRVKILMGIRLVKCHRDDIHSNMKVKRGKPHKLETQI